MFSSDESHSGFFMGALVGGAIGALSVLLFTTKQGEKIQRKAFNKFLDLEEKAYEKLQDLEDSATSLITPKPKHRAKRKSRAKHPAAHKPAAHG